MSTTASRRVTAADVAAAAGVSRATVSFVLNATPGQTISEAVKARVHSEALRLGYRPHASASALARGSNRIILMPLPRWPVEHVLSQILTEAGTVLDAAGYTLVTASPHHSPATRPLWDTLQPDLIMPLEALPDEELRSIREGGIPVLTFDATEADLVRLVDMQVRHLAHRGHRHLGFAETTIPALASMNSLRRDAAADAARRLGCTVESAAVTSQNASERLRGWLRGGVTAVVCFNDEVAALVIGAALRDGIRIPDELAVIGHDDVPISRMMVPSITTLHFDISGLGHYMAELALAKVAGLPAPSTELPSTRAVVVQREST